jgi:hypothetical protein
VFLSASSNGSVSLSIFCSDLFMPISVLIGYNRRCHRTLINYSHRLWAPSPIRKERTKGRNWRRINGFQTSRNVFGSMTFLGSGKTQKMLFDERLCVLSSRRSDLIPWLIQR